MTDEHASEQIAEQAALRWLGWIDQGNAAESYALAAPIFQQAVSVELWEQSLDRAQKPIGRARSRALRSRQEATELPGAPDGEYVMLEYATEFEHKKNGTETVVLLRQSNGEWRVSGYWIR